MEDRFYIYLHVKLTNGEPFYVGKGSNDRSSHSGKQRSKYWNSVVKKYGYDIIILEDSLTEVESLEKEMYWIRRIGRKDLGLGPLVNLTDGGDNSNPSIETKNRISNKLIEFYKSEKGIKLKEHLRSVNTGKKHSQESIELMKIKQKQKKLPDGFRENVSKGIKEWHRKRKENK